MIFRRFHVVFMKILVSFILAIQLMGCGGGAGSAGPVRNNAMVVGLADTTPLSVPQNLRAFAPGGTQVNLSWDPSTDVGEVVAGYELFRDDVGLLATVTGNSYTDSSVSPNHTYAYSVLAFDNSVPRNESALSSPPVDVTTPASTSGGTSSSSTTSSSTTTSGSDTTSGDSGIYQNPPTTSDPAMYGLPMPSPLPTLPAGFTPFAAPDISTGGYAPQIAAYMPTAAADETVPMTGVGFTADTRFELYVQTGASTAATFELDPVVSDNLTAAVTLPAALGAWDLYALWPREGTLKGSPVLLNRTEAWWVGPKLLWPGLKFAVYGRNLSHDNGTTAAWIYLKPASAQTGRWLVPTAVNPYRVEVELPAVVAPGDYEIWAHNGHGGHFGWSGPLAVQVVARSVWPIDTDPLVNVMDYGAKGDGTTDDAAAIQKTLDAAAAEAPATVYFPAGTYIVSMGFFPPNNVRWLGDGKDSTVIKNATNWNNVDGRIMPIWRNPGMNMEFEQITFDSNGINRGQWEGLIAMRNITNLRMDNVRLISWGGKVFEIYGQNLHFNQVEMIGRGAWFGWSRQVFVDGCLSGESEDYGQALGTWGGSDYAITNCTFQDADPSRPDGFAGGRMFVTQGHWGSIRNLYFGDNRTMNYAPRPERPDLNGGEIILFEMAGGANARTPTTATANTVNFAGDNLDLDAITAGHGPNVDAMIVKGRGMGQTAHVTHFDAASQTITVSPPWRVVPDGSSGIVVSAATSKAVVYDNNFEGRDNYAKLETASTAVQPWGSTHDVIIANNTIRHMRGGIRNFSLGFDKNYLGPMFFNLLTDNQISDCIDGIQIINYHGDHVMNIFGQDSTFTDPGTIGSTGIIARHNSISNMIDRGLSIDTDYGIGADNDTQTFEHNVLNNVPNPIVIQPTIDPTRTQIRNIVHRP